MKKFKFRLEPLLKVKKHLEKQKQKEHAESIRKVLGQKNNLKGIGTEKDQMLLDQRSKLTGKIYPRQLLSYSRYLVKLKKDMLAGTEILRSFERKADETRELLLQASKERKIQEELKDRLKNRYLKEITTFEQKQSDEISTNSFLRSKITKEQIKKSQ